MALTYSLSRGWPLYEAMYLSSFTLEWLEQQEQLQLHQNVFLELHSNLGKLAFAIGEFVERGSRGDFAHADALPIVEQYIDALNSMTQMLMSKTRETLLPQAPANLRDMINPQLSTIDALSARIEDILEAWKISLDEQRSEDLRSRMGEIDRTREDIPPWRGDLELISD